MQGWISLHRKIQDSFLWKDGRVFSKAEAWIDILMEVQHDHKQSKIMIKNTLITCDRGQSVKSLTTWADRWNWSKSAVRRFLELLKTEGMIRTESVTKSTRLSVCNYNTYQQRRTADEPQMNRKRNASEPQVAPDNNVNNGNNDNNGKLYTLQQVKDSGYLIGFRDPECLAFFTHYDAQGWVLGNRLPIANLSSAMSKWRNNGYKFPDAPKPAPDPTEVKHKQWHAQCGLWLRGATKEELESHGDFRQRLKEALFRTWAESINPQVRSMA